MSAREALFVAAGFCAALVLALILALSTLGSSNRQLQDRLISLQREADDERRKAAETTAAAMKELQNAVAAEAEARRSAEISRRREMEFEARARQREAEAASAAAVAQAKAEAERAAAERIAAAEKAATGNAGLATAAPTPAPADSLYQQAVVLEREGKFPEAVRLYTQAARSGHAAAAKRLGEIYDKGLPGISQNYAESLKWYNTLRVLGQETPAQSGRQ